MTTYPDFIKKERDKILQKRAELRWKFFEEEGYRKLSDVFGLSITGKDNYIKKNRCIYVSLLYSKCKSRTWFSKW